MKIKKSSLFLTTTLILLVLLMISILTQGFGLTTCATASSDNTLLYLYPQGCKTCDISNFDDILNKISSESASYEANFVRSPLVLFPKENQIFLVDASDKSSLAKDLCSLTADEDLCSLSKQLLCEGVAKTDKPNVKLFYMSYCPFGQQAFKSLAQVAALFGDKVDIEPHFVIYENYQGGSSDYCLDNGKICSMHGIKELNEDIREACVYKYDQDKFWNYAVCVMNSCSLQEVDSCWETCADKYSIDKNKIKSCFEEEGITLMRAEKQLDQKYGATGSPTIILNEESYTGGRSPEDFKQAICCGFNTPPEECAEELSQTASASGSCS